MIDLRPHFKHLHWRPMPHSMGVPVASDWADKADDDPVFGLYKRCGLWTMDEVQILTACAAWLQGPWLDIGSHTGWTTAHIALNATRVDALDPMFRVEGFKSRALENIGNVPGCPVSLSFLRSDEFFADLAANDPGRKYAGICIDGDHSEGKPLEDAINAERHLAGEGVILFHDCVGKPTHDGVEYLVDRGFSCKVYPSVHGVAVCWRGQFVPPPYTRIPNVVAGVWHNLGSIVRFA